MTSAHLLSPDGRDDVTVSANRIIWNTLLELCLREDIALAELEAEPDGKGAVTPQELPLSALAHSRQQWVTLCRRRFALFVQVL